MRKAEPKAPRAEIAYEPWYNREKRVGQALIHQSSARFRILMAGRQSGKTRSGIAEICADVMENDHHVAWWVCPNYMVKDTAWRAIEAHLPPQIVKNKSAQQNPRFELNNGSVIFVRSADSPESLVSASLDFVVCDEAGQWKESAWEQGVSPMLVARPNARAFLIGTPRGKNWFHRMWLKGAPGPLKDPNYESFHWKTEDSPYATREYLFERRANMPGDLYLQEFEASPLENASSVFRHFRQCVRTMPMAADALTVLGVDLARKLDFSAIVAMNSKRQVTEIQRFQEDWPLQLRRIASTSFRLHFARCVVDATGEGDVVVSQLRDSGLQVEGYVLSTQSKQRLIDNLRIDLEQSRLSIPNDATLLAELEAYQYQYDDETRKYKYSAPEGQHDDLVIALALAAWGQRGASAYVNEQPVSYMGKRKNSSYMGQHG